MSARLPQADGGRRSTHAKGRTGRGGPGPRAAEPGSQIAREIVALAAMLSREVIDVMKTAPRRHREGTHEMPRTHPFGARGIAGSGRDVDGGIVPW